MVNYIDKTYANFERIFNAPPVKQRPFTPLQQTQRLVRPPQNVPPMPANMGRIPQTQQQPPVEQQEPEMPMEQRFPFAMKGK